MNDIKNISTFLLLFLIGATVSAQIDPENIGVVITNESVVNSENLEFSPAFYEDGIVFISTNVENEQFRIKDKRIDKNIMSIYWSQRDSLGLLTEPIPFASELLSRVHEGPLTFNRTGDQIFFTRNNNEKGKRKVSSDGIAKLKIYSSLKFRGNWLAPEDLSFNNNESNTVHPTISVEEDKLYFASDREGGQGGMDLYVVNRIGDAWGEPVNLGPSINSPGNEAFPFIHADGTLYFASDGLAGLGGFDLFYALPEEGSNGYRFADPVNLDAPFNSAMDDFGLILDRDKRNGYFSSNRAGGLGEDDIYNFYITGNTSLVGNPGGKLLKKTKLWVLVKDKYDGSLISEAQVTALPLAAVSPNKVITGSTAENAYLILPENLDKQLILQLAIDSTDIFGLTDADGKVPLVFAGEENLVNVTKAGYQSKQVVLTGYAEGEDIVIELEKAIDCIPFTGEVLGVLSRPMIGAEVVIKDKATGEEQKITLDQKGLFEYCLRRNKIYTVSIKNDGKGIALHQIGLINTLSSHAQPITMTFNLADDPQLGLREGLTVELPNIYYNFNDASIRPDARLDLDVVVALLNKYPSMEIALSSHTDSRGGTRYNKQLSQKRAENAIKYLVNHGISRHRVEAVGLGETMLRNHCSDGVRCREIEHQFNRRSEVTITKFDRPDVELKVIQNTEIYPESQVNIARRNAVGGQRVTGGATRYRVIAGTFEVEENAQDRLTQVRNLGYQGAEIIQLENGHFKAVSVDSFGTDAEARELVRVLRDQYQLRSYIKRIKE